MACQIKHVVYQASRLLDLASFTLYLFNVFIHSHCTTLPGTADFGQVPSIIVFRISCNQYIYFILHSSGEISIVFTDTKRTKGYLLSVPYRTGLALSQVEKFVEAVPVLTYLFCQYKLLYTKLILLPSLLSYFFLNEWINLQKTPFLLFELYSEPRKNVERGLYDIRDNEWNLKIWNLSNVNDCNVAPWWAS